MASHESEPDAMTPSKKGQPIKTSRDLLLLNEQSDVPKALLIRKPPVTHSPIKTFRVPQSSILGKLKEFMPAMQAANLQLQNSSVPPQSIVEFVDDFDDDDSDKSVDDQDEGAATAEGDRADMPSSDSSLSDKPYVEMRLALALDDGESSDDSSESESNAAVNVTSEERLSEDEDFILGHGDCILSSSNLKLPSAASSKKPPSIEELADSGP